MLKVLKTCQSIKNRKFKVIPHVVAEIVKFTDFNENW